MQLYQNIWNYTYNIQNYNQTEQIGGFSVGRPIFRFSETFPTQNLESRSAASYDRASWAKINGLVEGNICKESVDWKPENTGFSVCGLLNKFWAYEIECIDPDSARLPKCGRTVGGRQRPRQHRGDQPSWRRWCSWWLGEGRLSQSDQISSG